MHTIEGTYRGGQIHLDSPVDRPDGLRVEVVDPARDRAGRSEGDWPDTPEERAALVARFKAVGPLQLTPQDEAEIAAARAEVREVTLRAVRAKMGLP